MRKKVWAERGRPSGRYHSYADIRLLEYLAEISMKHGIDSDEFFGSFLDASQHQESKCGKLSIECRMRTQDHAVFLVTSGPKVVAQFRMPERVLQENNLIKEFMRTMVPVGNSAREAKSNHHQIKDLKAGMRHIKIEARVLEVSHPMLITTRFGSYANVANALITDGSGTIQLPLWNKQIDEISMGDLVQVENANVIAFRGVRQLRVGRSGRLNVIKMVSTLDCKK